MNQELKSLQQEIDRDFGIYQSKFKDLEEAQTKFREFEVKQDNLNLTMAYFNKLVDSKRKEIMNKVVGIVNTGLQTIFQNSSMKLVVRERLQRNQKFYTLAVSIDGVETDDWNSASGGVVDVMSFMLRVVLISISSNRRFLVLDEPFKGLSKGYRENLGEFLQTVSKQLGVQFFIVSHQQEIDSAATNLFEIRQVEGQSVIIPVE